MIIRLRGNVERLLPTSVEIEVQGVSYLVEVPLLVSSELSGKSEVTLEIAQIIREDSQSLYGFSTREMRDIFLKLLKVNGVGARSALAILSSYSVADFMGIIATNNASALKSVKGIGVKTAGKIMLELAGYTQNLQGLQQGGEMRLVFDSLISLGFKDSEINKALQGLSHEAMKLDSSEIIKLVLKNMNR